MHVYRCCSTRQPRPDPGEIAASGWWTPAALAAWMTARPQDFTAAFRAIFVVTQGALPGTPCGMCRQVLAELAPGIPVRCETVDGARLDTDVATLLPHAFDAERLT